jgi:hypothetical protein
MVKSSMFATVFGLKQLAIPTAFQVPFLGSSFWNQRQAREDEPAGGME